MRTLAKIDAELAKLRAQKDAIQEKLRALVKERDAAVGVEDARRTVAGLSPEQRALIAQEISGAGGIASREKVGR